MWTVKIPKQIGKHQFELIKKLINFHIKLKIIDLYAFTFLKRTLFNPLFLLKILNVCLN